MERWPDSRVPPTRASRASLQRWSLVDPDTVIGDRHHAQSIDSTDRSNSTQSERATTPPPQPMPNLSDLCGVSAVLHVPRSRPQLSRAVQVFRHNNSQGMTHAQIIGCGGTAQTVCGRVEAVCFAFVSCLSAPTEVIHSTCTSMVLSVTLSCIASQARGYQGY
jgi:hypothetical protein